MTTVRQHLELTGLSYADWHKEAAEIMAAADAAETGGQWVDGKHLTRAGQIVESINAELAGLDELLKELTGETAGQVDSVRDLLTALRNNINDAARCMHGRT